MMQTVELISTGSELLSGRTVNRHAQTLGRNLFSLGLRFVRDTTIPDDAALITDVLRTALQRSDVVMITGGLGPTDDDVTRDAVAELLGRKMVLDSPSVENIRHKCEARGLDFNKAREGQALVIDGAEVLPNSVGAAPGQRLGLDDKVLFLLPGPPGEFLAVLTEQVVPWLTEHRKTDEGPIEKLFLVCGMAEADILTCFEENNFPPENIDTAFCAAPGRIEVRLSSSSTENLNSAAADVRNLLGDRIFAEERVTMEEVVGSLLTRNNQTLATAESCTGGLVGHRITNVSGSSGYYRGGVVAYANDIKVQELGVDPVVLEKEGAVSAPVARQMAVGVRKRFNSDFGLSLTGIAGPTGGTQEKPVGLVYTGLADGKGSIADEFRFGSGRSRIKQWSSQMALNLLRLRLL